MRSCFLVFAFFIATEAFANNMFIPNHYRSRRTGNAFSALAWSHRKEASLQYKKTEEDQKQSGTKITEVESSSYGPDVFYRLNENLNFEFQMVRDHQKDKDLTVPSETSDNYDSYSSGIGYVLSELPLAVSAQLIQTFQSGDDTKVSNLGIGYQLENQTYLGAGYGNIFDRSTTHFYILGYGKVWGDEKLVDATAEGFLQWASQDGYDYQRLGLRGLWNQEAVQYYAEVGLSYFERPGFKYDSPSLRVGLDYQFDVFYVSPDINWQTYNYSGSNSVADEDNLIFSLEAGYRAHELEAFVRYNNSRELEKATSLDPKFERLGQTWALGFTKFFN